MVTSADRSALSLLAELDKNERGEALAKLVHALAVSAYDERRSDLQEGLADAAERLGVDEPSADTSYGNALRALRKGASATAAEKELLGVLLARGVELAPPEDDAAAEGVALVLAWAAANTPADALTPLDSVLSETASDMWRAAGKILSREDESPSAVVSRPSLVMFAAALGASKSNTAATLRGSLATTLRDPLLKSLVSRAGDAGSGAPLVLSAEVMPGPRSFPVVFLLTATFILPIIAALRLLGRYALHLRRPAELRVTEGGVTVQSRFELLGRTLRESELHIPRSALARVAREVRYPRLATYVGLIALLIGSYVGFRLIIDGARAGAPEFLGIGLVVLVVGLLVDYALSRLPSRVSGGCELLFEGRRGRPIALAAVDPVLADRALNLLARPPAEPVAPKT
jgi:hypothetical protein